MASNDDLRCLDQRPAKAGRVRVWIGLAAAAGVATLIAALLLLAQLASQPESQGIGSTPGFLTKALGAPQASASLVRKPAAGLRAHLGASGLTVATAGTPAARMPIVHVPEAHKHKYEKPAKSKIDPEDLPAGSVSLAAVDGGDAEWRRFANGASRPTAFGRETITFSRRRVEEFLTVAERQGQKTWRWRLRNEGLRPRIGDDGSVAFLSGHRLSDLSIEPVEILDARGRKITPAGLRWSLAQEGASWWLELELDDSSLPLPYVIDPSIAFRSVAGNNNDADRTRLTLSMPSPGVVPGDFLLAQVAVRGTPTITAPGDWSLVSSTPSVGSAVTQAIYSRRATGTETATYTWSFSASQKAAGGIVAYAGVSGIANSGPQTAGSGTSTAPSVSVSTSPVTVVAFFTKATLASAFNVSANLTMRYKANSTGGGTSTNVTVASGDVSQTGTGTWATGAKTVDISNCNSADYVGHTIALSLDTTLPTSSVALTSQSPTGSSYLSGTTVYYRGVAAGSFQLRNTVTDTLSGVASSRFPALGPTVGGWTHIADETVSTPVGGPFTSTVAFAWPAGETASPTEGVYGTDNAGNDSATTTLTFTNDSTAPPLPVTNFPLDAAGYNLSGWEAGCGTPAVGDLCGTAAADGGSGLARVELSIRRDSDGWWWNGSLSAFVSAEVFNLATGTSSWSYSFAPPAEGSYTIKVQAIDNVGNVATASTRTFTYDTTAPTANSLSLVGISPAGAAALSGSTVYYRGSATGGGSFQIRNAVTDNAGGSGPGSSETAPLGGMPGLWTHTPSSVSTPAGGPYDSSLFGWPEGETASPTEVVTGRDAAGNPIAAPSLTFVNDSSVPTPGITFPSGANNTAGWNAGCAPVGFCGTTAADGGSGLATVELSIKRDSNGDYWNGTAFAPVPEDWRPATGTSSWSYGFAAVNFPADGSYTIRVRSKDNVGNTAIASLTFTYDTAAPADPASLTTSPASPANNNNPQVKGTAEAGSTVNIYATADCTGASVASGTAALFGGAGIDVPDVLDNSSTSYSAKATDQANNTSGCSPTPVSYVEDSNAPAEPGSLTTSPASPANNNNPQVKGTAEAGSTVNIYATADCTGASVASGTAALFGGAGIDVPDVLDNSSTSYSAKATDQANNTSGCSPTPVSYVEDSNAPLPPGSLLSSPGSPANDNNPEITGSAEAGSTVRLYTTSDCSGAPLATETAANFATPGITVTVSDNTSTTYKATATDAAGNVSACSTGYAYTEDSAAPGPPTVSGSSPALPANDNNPEITGSAEAGSTVRLYTNATCTSAVAATGTAAAFATPGLTVTVTDNTSTTLYATATDAAGNASGCSAAGLTYVEDSAAPAAPTISGSSPSSPANNNSPAITGSAEAGSTINLYTNATCTSAVAATGTAAAFATPGLTVTVTDNASTSFYATATDAAGNTSACSAGDTYVEDSSAPAVPTVSGSSPASPANNNSPAITGSAEAGSTVNLYTNATCTSAVAATGAAAAFATPGLTVTVTDNTSTSFYATATDAAGNASGCSAAGLTYVEDSAAPTAPTISGSSPSSPANNNSPAITGSAEAASTIKLYTNSTCTSAIAATGAAAAFSSPGLTVTVTDDTSTSYYATATDQAGNTSTCSSTSVSYTEDSTPPGTPGGLTTSPVSPANNNNPQVKGSAEAGSTVTIYASSDCSGASVGSGSTALFGGAGIDVPDVLDNSSTTYSAKATDQANNTSGCSPAPVSYVEDSVAPAAPDPLSSSPGSPSNDETPDITGSAEAGSTVRLYTSSDCSGAPVATGTAAAFATPGLNATVAENASTTFKATATDQANNTSACSAGYTYIEDSLAPAAPASLTTSPASPANNNNPQVKGTAEAGSTVNIYATADCTGASVASGTAALFGGPGIDVPDVLDNSSTTYSAKATDQANNTSACSPTPLSYVEDSTAPADPSALTTSPASPANNNNPQVKGTAEAGSTVTIYASSDCSGGSVASGSAALFGGAGIDVPDVLDNTTTTYSAKATDQANNSSLCSPIPVGYTEDSSAPAEPSSLMTSPASPANNNNPQLKGTAEAGSTVTIYASSDCSGGSVASGSAALFGGAGIDVPDVLDNTTTTYSAKATDQANNSSLCSPTSVTYVEDSLAPPEPTISSSTPASPSSNNSPNLSGAAEAGSTVRIYTNSTCTSAIAASGSAATFGSPGLSVSVADNTTTDFYATTTDQAGNPSGCSLTPLTYVEDSAAPALPTVSDSSPSSPANNNSPLISGAAEAGSTVRLYTTSDCSGAIAASGTAAAFSSPGLWVSVGDNTSTNFYATATDAANNTSLCSTTSVSYVEDSVAPGEPGPLSSSPGSPSNDETPDITGSAEAGSTVRLYTSSDCSGAPVATGTAAAFATPGLNATVAENASTTFKATATDAAGNTSACSSGVTYTEDSTAPAAPSIASSSPASPANDNTPELSGSAEVGSTVKLYTASDCTGAIAASGSAAAFGGAGLTVTVGDNSSTSFYATATDAAGNASGCSSPALVYVEDSAPPAAPTGLTTTPASPANDNSPAVQGTAEASSTVRVYTTSDCSGAAAASGTATAFGGAGLSVAVADDSATTFKATATDAAGNTSACSTGVTYAEDSTAPAAPSTLSSTPGSPANNNSPAITGSAEGGSTVKLFTTSDCSGAPVASGSAASFATPGFTVAVSDESSTTYKATATDAAGNASTCSTGVSYVEDSTAPGAPSGLSLTPASPANNNNPQMSGAAEAGSTVKLYTSSDCSGAPAATGGAAEFSSPGLTAAVADDSTTTFKATATDAAGNTSACSTGVTYMEDSTAPGAPGSLGTSPGSPANDNSPSVSGSAEASSTVKLYPTTDCLGAPSATGGAAAFASPGLTVAVANDTTTTFKATATDLAGNTSACSAGVTYVEDSTAPVAPSALGVTPASPANNNNPNVTGTAEAASTVKVYTNATCTSAVAASGTAAAFNTPGLAVAVGDNTTTTFYATATDGAGNVSPCSSGVTFVEDSTAPATPSISSSSPASPANDNSPALSGSAESGSTVKLYTNVTCTSAVAASGTAAAFATPGFTVAVANDTTTSYYATATDAAGNVSGCSSPELIYVEDSTAPVAPSSLSLSPASPANDNSPKVLGTAETGSTVKLYTNSTCTSAVAGSGTAANFNAPGLAAAVGDDTATTFYATATDTAGNASPCSSGVTYNEDSTAPAAPSALSSSPGSPANNNNPAITGSGEAGSTVKLYTNPTCTSAVAATGTAAAFATPGLAVAVTDDTTTTFYATATDAAGNASACSSGYAYVEDSTAPVAPSSLSLSPASPANNNSPMVLGTAEAGSTVKLYTNSTCTSAVAASGTAAAFNSPGLTASVSDDTSTTFYATATDAAGNASACSSGVTYVEDSTAPGAPGSLVTSPGSPANNNNPAVSGSAEAGSTVKLYTTSDCSGGVAASGTAGAFGGAGLAVSVPDDTSTTFKSTATDAAGNTSACSMGVTYVEDSTTPAAPSSLATTPASPANDNNPNVTGTVEAGSTVKLYTSSDCSGAAVASGSAATFASPGIARTVSDDSSSTWYATATDAAGNASTCSSGISYVEDSTAPAAPSSLSTTPASPANDNSPKVSGTAEAGSAIKLYTTSDCSGAPTATGSAASFSAPGLAASVALDSTTIFKTTATDAAGNTSACSAGVSYVEDSTAPAAPSALDTNPASPANNNDPYVFGTAEANSTVKLYTTSDCSGAPAATDTAANFAAPGIQRTVPDDSSRTWYATATDAAGNTSSCSGGVIYVEDSTAPAAPSSLSSTPGSPANDNNPKIAGTAEAGTTVRLYTTSDCSGASVASGSAASFSAPGLAVSVAEDSTSSFRATARDAAGNTSACSSAVSYVEDSTAPATPSALSTTPASPANDNSPKITGTAEVGSTVKLFTTSDCSGAVAASGSATSFASPGLTVSVSNDSATTFKATATDAAGNTSACSSGVSYVEDSTAPAAPSGLSTTPGSPANDNNPKIGGAAEAGSTVKLYTSSDCSGAPAATGSAASFASPGLTATVANDSTTTFKATATDLAGNTSSCSTGATYNEDSTAPAAPSTLISSPGSPANDNNPEFTGSAEAGSNVKLFTSSDCSGAPVASGNAASFATPGFTVAVADDSTTTYKATATDAAGNESSCSSGYAYVEDSIAPAAPSSLGTTPPSPANDNSPNVTGNAEAGATVKLYTSSDCTGATAANGSAASFSSPGLPVSVSDDSSTTFKGTATDAAGNVSGCSSGVAYVEDSAVPSSSTTFPANGQSYSASAWNAGCATNGLCGAASDVGSGLQRVEVSIKRESDGQYWNGSSFASPTEDWQIAMGTSTWSYAHGSASFPADGDYTVRVRARDNAGNVETASSRTFTIDTQAPADPSGLASTPGSPANDNAPKLAGIAEAGSTVKLYTSSDCSGAPETSGSAAAFTGAGITVSVSDNSTTTFKATATDVAGNVSGCSAGFAFVEDSAAPAAPSGLASTPASPANDSNPKVIGTAEAGSTVKLYTSSDCSGAPLGSGTAASFATPGFTVAVADDSTTTYKATATDASGNVSGCSVGLTYVEDSTAPGSPGSLATTPASPANNNAPKVIGSGEAGSTVKLYTSADCSGAPAASGTAGAFSFPGLTVSVADDSTTTFKATATDAAGNVSGCSAGVTYSEDSTAPAAPSGLASSPVSPANDNDPELTGTAEAGSTVKLYTSSDCSGAPVTTGSAATFGGAGLTVSVGNDSATTYKATATDAAGNVSSCSSGYVYVEDSTAPSAPSGLASTPASPANDNSPKVNGAAESGSTVKLYTSADCSGAPVTTGGAAAFGSPGLAVTVADDSSTSYKVTATDAAGNTSSCSTGVTYTEDSSAPAAPSALSTTPASPTNDNNPKVSGTTEAGSTVKLYTSSDCSGAPVATGGAAAFGSPGLSVSVADDSSTTYKATATDAAGNTSSCSTGVTYTEDSSAPAAPSGLASTPASPANDNNPKVGGTAEAGSTIKLYTSADCSGAPVATGGAAAFSGAGVTVTVSDDSSTTLKATATDAAGNVSGCSTAVTYVEDSTAPAVPSGLASTPVSPANDNSPKVSGGSEAGSTVRLYTSSDCTGAAAATGSAGSFSSTGLAVSVADDSSSTFKATASDAAGNVSSCSTGVTYDEDSTAPSSTTSFPANITSYNIAGWNAGCSPSGICGSASDGGAGLDRVEVSIRRDGIGDYWNGSNFSSPTEVWNPATGTGTWNLGLAASGFPADGTYTVRVRARDNASNVEAPASRTFTVDTGAPNTTIDSGPADPTSNQDPSFAFSASESGTTYECRLDNGSWASCTSPNGYIGLAEGSHTFDVRATDSAGNTDASPASQTWLIDRTDPTSAFTFPAAGGSYNAAGWQDFAGTASDSGLAGLDRVDVSIRRVSDNQYWNGSGFSSPTEVWNAASGTSSWSLAFPASSFPADGDYAVRARARDNAGNLQAPVARTFTVDTVAPETTIDSAPANPVNSTSADFTFSADQPGSTFECRLDAGTWAACASPKTYTGLAQGSHTFEVRATDTGNNTDATPAARTWTVDTVPPVANMDNPGPYHRGLVSLTASASDTGGSGIASTAFQKSAAGAGSWSPVPATWSTAAADDGLYDFRVVATDNAGNSTQSSPVSNIWVDNTAPNAVVDDPGANVSGTVNLTDSSTDASSGIASKQFEYRELPDGTFQTTPAAWDTLVLLDGQYEVRVVVTDRAGNTGFSAPKQTLVDNTPPDVTFSVPVDGGSVNAAAADPYGLAASAVDTGSGVKEVEFFDCTAGGSSCTSSSSLGVDSAAPFQGSWPLPATDGLHSVKVVARDNADHEASAIVTVMVDRAVPDTNLITYPADPSNVVAPQFTFDSTETGSTFECRVDAGTWTACTTPHTTATLADGSHTFEVRAIDAAGNVDGSPASWTWLLDATPPTAAMDDPGPTLRGSIPLSSSQADTGGSGIATVEYQYSVANADNWAGTTSPWDTTLVNDDLYDVRVVVTDVAGNVTESAPVEDRRVDNTPPETAIDDPGANVRSAITLRGSASDTGSGVQQVDFQISPTGGNSWTTVGSSAGPSYEVSFDTAMFADGIYDFRTVATDVAGNVKEGTPVVGRRIDNTPPTASMNDPGANLRGAVNLGSVSDDAGGSGVSTVVYEALIGSTWTPISQTWATTSVPDGVYDLHVVVTDLAGNQTISAPVTGRRVDNTKPTTSDNAPGGWQASGVTVGLSASDAGSGVANTQFSVDGGGYQSGTSVSISSDGIHTISYFSTDVVGNIESPRTATVMIDTTPPDPGANDPGNYLRGTVTLSANPDAGTEGAQVTEVEFQRSVAGANAWTQIGLDNTGPGPYSAGWATTPADDGSWDLRFIVRDETGRETTVDLPSKIVDNTAPTGSIGSPLAGSTVSGGVNIGVSASDANPIASVEFFVRGSSIGTSSAGPFQQSWNSASGPDGTAGISAVITDMAGNSTSTGTVSVSVDNFAPAVSLSSPGSTIRGTVTLSASADSDVTQVTFERRTGGGGWSNVGVDTGAPWSASFDTTGLNGSYELRAIAVDAGANSSTSNTVTTLVDNTNPTGLLTRPNDGANVGGNVALEATASDSGSGVGSVTWEARPAGGSFSAVASDSSAPYAANWNAAATGTYDLQLVVTDMAGNTFTSNPITIDVDATPPGVTLGDPGSPLSGTVGLSAATTGDADSVTFGYSPAGGASWSAIATDGSAPYTANFNTTNLGDGVYDLRAIVSDALGNTAQSVRAGIRVDNFVPIIVSSVPAGGSIVASASSVAITSSEDIAALTGVELDGAPAVAPVISGNTGTFNTGALAEGSHTLTGTVRDAAGKSSSFSISFVVGVPAPAPDVSSSLPGTPDLDLAPVPAPANFRGVLESDGSLTLRWEVATGADGTAFATVLYVDGIATRSLAPGEEEVNLGPFDPADMRFFSIAAVDGAGQASTESVKLRSSSVLAGKSAEEAGAILVNRGFAVGLVRGAGTIVVKPQRAVMAPLGSKVDLELGELGAPQTKLVFNVVGTKKFSWSERKYIALRVQTTRPSQVTATLLSPSGERVYHWRFKTKAGAQVIKLTMPPQVRRPGKYHLVLTIQSGNETIRRTMVVEIVGKKPGRAVKPDKRPVEVVLAGSSNIRRDIALGLEDEGLRVVSSTGDETWGVTGDTNRNVKVLVIDVDRYGVALVRDLRTVFPSVAIIALTNDPRRLAASVRAGATVAVPGTTPPNELAKLIRRLAKRS